MKRTLFFLTLGLAVLRPLPLGAADGKSTVNVVKTNAVITGLTLFSGAIKVGELDYQRVLSSGLTLDIDAIYGSVEADAAYPVGGVLVTVGPGLYGAGTAPVGLYIRPAVGVAYSLPDGGWFPCLQGLIGYQLVHRKVLIFDLSYGGVFWFGYNRPFPGESGGWNHGQLPIVKGSIGIAF